MEGLIEIFQKKFMFQCFYGSKVSPLEIRKIFINNKKPDNEFYRVDLKYSSNRIKTSKYNLFTFLPINIYEQFRRVANFYFITNITISFIIPNPVASPFTSLFPLLFVIFCTAVKQGYEDILRHRSDRIINNLPVKILRNGTFKKLKWRDIKCGDIVQVNAETQLPCDLVLLHSDMKDGICYITTANLDGETNLKRRSVPSKFPALKTESDFSNLRGVIKCDLPNLRLYEFNGKIIVNGQQYPIVNENILLRGSTLKIAPVIYGCAIYTGQETKMMLNSKFKSNKLSCIEKRINFLIGLCILFIITVVLICFISPMVYFSDIYTYHWYLSGRKPYYHGNTAYYNFIELLTKINLFSFIIPISLFVSIELQRFMGAKFVECDIKLYDEETNQPAKVNTSDLNEDLGQVEYLFSDKTGTLTINEMEFRQFSINGVIYEEFNGDISEIKSNNKIKIFEVSVLKFLYRIKVTYSSDLDRFFL
jgi:phospholipid-translocating ATPase